MSDNKLLNNADQQNNMFTWQKLCRHEAIEPHESTERNCDINAWTSLAQMLNIA